MSTPSPAPEPARPMSRVTVRDFPAVVWLMATAFARPARNRPPIGWVRLALVPMMVVFATTPGTRHWNRVAVLTVRRYLSPAVIAWWIASLVALLVPLFTLVVIVAVPAWVLALVAAAVVAPGVGIAYVRLVASRLPRRRVPLTGAAARGEVPPRARWTATMAASAPGVDAVRTVFAPHVLATVPSGQTLRARASSSYLADRYVEAGLTRVAGSAREVFFTAP